MTLSEQRPKGSGKDLPTHERRRLIAAATGRGLGDVKSAMEMSPDEQSRFDLLAAQRLDGEPLQYLEGTVVFGSVEVAVDHRVLIPRPETEHLLELVPKLPSPRIVVDLCTGSGALALALKKLFPEARVIGADVSSAALDLARANGVANGLSVEWREGDLFQAIPPGVFGEVDLLVANPPYVAERDWGALPPDVQREPRLALIAGPTGMEVAERILGETHRWIGSSGEAWVEVGEDQAQELARRFSAQVVFDQYGRDRFVRVTNS